MTDNKEKTAIQYLFESEPEQALTAQDISRTLGFRAKQIKRLHELLQQMVRDGEIVTACERTIVQLDCRNAMIELSLEVEPAANSPGLDSLPHRLEQSLQAALNLRVPVIILPSGSLPRFEMKAQRWVRVTE